MAQYLILGMYKDPAASDRRPETVQPKKPQLSSSAERIIYELNMPVRA